MAFVVSLTVWLWTLYEMLLMTEREVARVAFAEQEMTCPEQVGYSTFLVQIRLRGKTETQTGCAVTGA